jgi:hypothetical protein
MSVRYAGRGTLVKNCVLVLDPCNLYSLRALLGGLFSSANLARPPRPPPSACFHYRHLTRFISAVISSLRGGCLEESESGAAPFGGVWDRRALERYTEKARARFSSHARKPASTVTRTSSRSTCRSDYCARIAGAHKLVNQKGGRQSRCAGLLEPEKLNPRLRSLDRYSDSETWNIARVQAIGLAPQSRSATVKLASYGCRY